MSREQARRDRALDRKGARRDKGPGLALAIVLTGIVAALGAAALMVYGVQTLGTASSATADQATDVPGQVVVHSAHAVRMEREVATIHFYVGSDGRDVDLAGMELWLELQDDQQLYRYGSDALELLVQRDLDGSVGSSAPSMGRGDLVELVLHMDMVGTAIGVGDHFVLRWEGSTQGTPSTQGTIPSVGAGSILPLNLG